MRGIGAELLYRAGYIDRELALTALGKHFVDQNKKVFSSSVSNNELSFAERTRVARDTEGGLFVLSEYGRETICYCDHCGYGNTPELFPVNKKPFESADQLPVEKILTPECHTIKDLAAYLNIPEQRTAKALLYSRVEDGKVVFVVVRGDQQMSVPKLESVVGKTRLATEEEIASIGAVPGYASPIGAHNALIVVDRLIEDSPNLVAGANEPGYHLLNTNYGRDYTAQISADLTIADVTDACPTCGGEIRMAKAYDGKEDIRVPLLLALAEEMNDDRGSLWKLACAPADVYLMNIPGKKTDTAAVLGELETALNSVGYSVLVDDREERAGIKFNDADLIGCPIRIAVGERGLAENAVEVKARDGSVSELVPISELTAKIIELFPKG